MASFRTGFKIFGEFSLKQGFGRIRSFSEDRKPGQWLAEDQWTVRQPGTTCPEPCDKPLKPPKASKSWLSICKDPKIPIECDIRHNNCPPPLLKPEEPWYSLDNLIPQKKQEKSSSLHSCREEMKRREICGENEEVCETFPVHIKPEFPECCMPKQDPCPAPVVTLSCPIPKELDIMLWCGQPSTDTSRIAQKCKSDRLPYQEFRPQKCWKLPPFSLSTKSNLPTFQSSSCNARPIEYSEFKQVEVPKPLYTRYKSVELSESNLLFCMIDAKCTDNYAVNSLAITPYLPNPDPEPPVQLDNKKEICLEKPFVEVGSCKPVRIKKAPKHTFRPKPTKLIEKRIFKNPCAQHKNCDLTFKPLGEDDASDCDCTSSEVFQNFEPSKVITDTLIKEPQTFEGNFFSSNDPPSWMYILCKPGSKETPLIPFAYQEYPKEPDWCSETDGLKFYDGENDCLYPKPPPDPLATVDAEIRREEAPDFFSASNSALAPEPTAVKEAGKLCFAFRDRYVLMPEKYNIRNMRPKEVNHLKDNIHSSSFEKFIEAKTAIKKKKSNSYIPIKENILYDLQRLCPNVPFDPSKIKIACRKPPKLYCSKPPSRSYRTFSTFCPFPLRNLNYVWLNKIQQRTECGDSSEKCKVRKLTPKERECPEKKKPADCAAITLPCCPPAKIPPSCNVRKSMPPCKKKLPPKPSFSECSKDPPPCPKITECNCWEKKTGFEKGGKK